VCTVLIFSVFGLASALAPSFGWLLALRALTGFGLGGALPLDFSLFAEYLPRRNRGRHLVLLESFWALGTVLAAALALLIVPALGWRPLLASSAAAALLVVWIRRRVPESPRYLASAGRVAEAEAVLARVAAANGVPAPAIAPAPAAPSEQRRIAELWSRPLRRPTAVLWAAWFGIALGYYGLFSWLPTVFVDRGFSFVRTYEYAFLLALAQIPGYLSAAWLVERVGRRPVLATYLLASAGSTFLFAAGTTPAAILAGALLTSFFALGAWAALYALTPEVYPTVVRTTGMGAASATARVAGVLAPVLGGLLIPLSLPLALGLYAAAFGLAGVAVLALGIETRGRPLPDTLRGVPRAAGAHPTV
jgi:putative MFS transporter